MNSKATLSNLTRSGDTYTATIEFPATPEVVKALEPSFEMWKPDLKSGGEFWYIDSLGDVKRGHTRQNTCIFWLGSFPTRELAETQDEIEQITRKLNQAAVVYGGACQVSADRFGYNQMAYRGIYNTTGRCYFNWGFATIQTARTFSEAFEADLTRLAELNAQLTAGWQLYLETMK